MPVSRVQRMEAMLADEHVQGRKVLHRFADEAGALAGLTVPVSGFRLSRSPLQVTSPPQAVGAQNQELLAALGYPPADIDALRAQGVIA